MTEPTELQAIACGTENGALIEALDNRPRELHEVPTDVDALSVFIDPDGRVITVDKRAELEEDRTYPSRSDRIITVHGLDDMKAMAEKWYGEPELRNTFVTYADETDMTFVTVLDDHDDGVPGRRRHKLVYRLAFTPAMEAWLNHDRSWLDQVAFAEHLEDRLRDVIRPDSADLLEIAQTLSAKTSIDFRSGQRLVDGRAQLKYIEETDAVGGQSGDLEIPGRFALMIPPFVGTQAQEIEARFRFRMRSDGLKLGYLLDDVDQMKRDAFEQLFTEFEANVDWLTVRAVAPR